MDKKNEKKRRKQKKILSYSGFGILFLFIFYLLFISDKSSKLNVEKDRITISEVKNGPFEEFIPITGSIEPIQTFYLDLTEGGKIVQKFVEEGAFVKLGDPIIRLENANLSLQVMNTQSSFLAAESQLNIAQLTFEQNRLSKQMQLLDLNLRLLNQKRDFEIAKSLYDKELGNEFEFEASRDNLEYLTKSKELMLEVLRKDSLTSVQLVEQNKANVKRSKEYLELIENQLANLTVRAPITGQLTSLNAEIGQSVSFGYKLGRIDNTDKYKVRAEIAEHYIARVRVGQEGEFNFNGKSYNLVVQTVYPQVTNGIFYVDLQFTDEQPTGIRRGQAVHIKLQLSNLFQALMVQSGGFYSTTGGQWIFVVDKSESFAVRRPIKIGRQNPQYYEILEGLAPGEKVITSSYDNYGDIEKLILK